MVTVSPYGGSASLAMSSSLPYIMCCWNIRSTSTGLSPSVPTQHRIDCCTWCCIWCPCSSLMQPQQSERVQLSNHFDAEEATMSSMSSLQPSILNGADVPLRNYSLIHSLQPKHLVICFRRHFGKTANNFLHSASVITFTQCVYSLGLKSSIPC